MKKTDKFSTGRFFYSFGTVFLSAVLTICIINFTRDGRIFAKAAAPVRTETTTGDASAVEGTITVDTSVPGKSSGSASKKPKKPASQSKTPAGTTSDGAVQPSNPGEEP